MEGALLMLSPFTCIELGTTVVTTDWVRRYIVSVWSSQGHALYVRLTWKMEQTTHACPKPAHAGA